MQLGGVCHLCAENHCNKVDAFLPAESCLCWVVPPVVLCAAYLGHGVMTSNNDCFVRWFDVETWRPCYRLPFDWPVNYASLRPPSADPMGGPVVAVVGDDPVTAVMDLR